MSGNEAERRLAPEVLDAHWRSGVPVLVRLAGDPELDIRIDKPARRLTLRAPVAPGVDIPVTGLANVVADAIFEDGKHFIEISTIGEELLSDGYAMLMMVADRIQLAGLAPLGAFEETLELWESIIASRVRLGPEAEIGLFGELLLLEGLLNSGKAGAEAWRGGLSEEHDFGFAKTDVEVKTTSGERRQHRINGLGQLLETEGSRLWLLSVQITRGGDGQGRALPKLIDDVLELGGEAGRDKIAQNLAGFGWHESQRDLYADHWWLRSRPLLLRVEDSFPRITRDLLSGLSVDTAKIRDVDYEVDVTDIPEPLDPPVEMVEAISQIEESVDG